MQDFDTTMEQAATLGDEREGLRQRVWEFLIQLLRKVVLFISFGPGVLGVLWILGRIFKR